MKADTRFVVLVIAGVLLVLIAFSVILWMAGFFEVTGADPNSKIVAAALALVGVFFSAAVTLAGLLLKHSLDSRSEARAIEAEQRLKLEAAIKAVGLFTTAKGEVAPPIQLAGALFGLASLEQHSLALALTPQLMLNGYLDSGTACQLLDQALGSPLEPDRIAAVSVLVDHPEAMLTDGGCQCIPRSLANGLEEQPLAVRSWVPIVLGEVAVARPLHAWDRLELNSILAALALAWERESDAKAKADFAAILAGLLEALPDQRALYHPLKRLDVRDLRQRLLEPHAASSSAESLVVRIGKWAGQSTLETSPA